MIYWRDMGCAIRQAEQPCCMVLTMMSVVVVGCCLLPDIEVTTSIICIYIHTSMMSLNPEVHVVVIMPADPVANNGH